MHKMFKCHNYYIYPNKNYSFSVVNYYFTAKYCEFECACEFEGFVNSVTMFPFNVGDISESFWTSCNLHLHDTFEEFDLDLVNIK